MEKLKLLMKDILVLKKMEKMGFKHFVRSVMQKEREYECYRGKNAYKKRFICKDYMRGHLLNIFKYVYFKSKQI